MKLHGLIVVILLLLTGMTSAWAETRYVSDRLVITVREGMGNQYRVIKTLPTDSAVEVLEEQGRYLRVQLKDGTEGYVLKQYISRTVPKTTVIAKLKQDVANLEKKLADRHGSVNTLSESNAQLEESLIQTRRELEQVQQTLQQTQKEYSDLQDKAENVVLIDKERQQLKKEFAKLSEKAQRLEEQNAAVLKTAMIKWFVAGGGVLFVGWVAGKFSRKKRRTLGGF
ncbi:TIGR04211 family SH3 domain-containing protein [Desulfuromonas acetoxidans]|uniref:SH3, type 3 n=1 Tax=Desulfuromonas acetoxidans (strain DSM 684 / 11070) TaxID=281689 RepID=Q1JWM3_DESA6|nr:TIGR04211 family SH3 domain-containing protein [Desulfuromonas acetoxidans]EAT14656.1 SH3, type 3 [Desulfuromonas acetoxidans DSM 684]MBF0645052.1 TIGR04211 family SH3 domain-containing protein [Desulfuromonas acetoxidans]NVD23138.1 TIGR04211 family SH3 domain-containing protein [Desulfuromonas acetoxidans]NVE15621.1 TIGR04211 family SH3 domain-containing protein [Desulfuromonas acetoxidans]